MAKILRSSFPYKGPVSENLIDFIRIGLRKHADKTIIIDTQTNFHCNGRQLEECITSFARRLIERCKIKKGDICTLYGCPNDRFVMIYLAIICAGGVVNFLNDGYTPREVLDTSRALKAKFLISKRRTLVALAKTLADLKGQFHMISTDELLVVSGEEFEIIDDLLNELLNPPRELPTWKFEELALIASIDPENDYAVVQFSSGTTGKPKPIPRTHKNLCHLVACVDHEELMNMVPGEVICGGLPMTHRPGLWALLACINGGATFISGNHLDGVFSVISRFKGTILQSAVLSLSLLASTGLSIKDEYDLTSLKHIITAGAKIVHADLPRQIVREYNLQTLRQCFGMTEAGWVFLLEASKADADSYLTVGHAVPGCEVVVLDRDTLKPVGVNVRGELAVRGPQVFPGYLTDEPGVYNRADFTEDGWFRTGDQCYYDEQELIYIEGRYKELLIFENEGRFFPNEIEAIINEHPAVESSCVVKIGESKKNSTYDVARAFVTLKQGYNVTEEELLYFVNERAYEVLLDGGIGILDKFPRLHNGKIDKQALKNLS